MKNKNKIGIGDLVTYDIFGVGEVLYYDETDDKYRVRFKYGDQIHKFWCNENELEIYEKKSYNLNKYCNDLYLKLTEISLKYHIPFDIVVKRYKDIEKLLKEGK